MELRKWNGVTQKQKTGNWWRSTVSSQSLLLHYKGLGRGGKYTSKGLRLQKSFCYFLYSHDSYEMFRKSFASKCLPGSKLKLRKMVSNEIISVVNLCVTWKQNCTCDAINYVHIKNNFSPDSINSTRKGKIQMTLLIKYTQACL